MPSSAVLWAFRLSAFKTKIFVFWYGDNLLKEQFPNIVYSSIITEVSMSKLNNPIKVRAAASKDDCQNIEVWERVRGLVATFNMKEVDQHGKIYTDGEFGSLQLSEDKKTLYYIAEEKKEKNVPYLSQAPFKEDTKMGGEYK